MDPHTGSDALRQWFDVLAEERAEPYWAQLQHFVEQERAHEGEVYPEESAVYAAFDLTPFAKVRVVILGQDPYPNPGQAMGLSFSVPSGVPLPVSLRNIHIAMRAENIEPPEHGDLSGWAAQGVLLLNAGLTVRKNGAGRHLRIWRPFTDAVIRRLNDRTEPMVFVLWGAKAQRALHRGLVDPERHHVVTAPHPASRGASQRAFREARTFGRVNDLITGDPINWSG
ncbi:uracil-DNA glycosylase [Nocardioides sp. 31GB23]|uniref:uracil-DNA glycosylase n=1 Tax=Nocardioides sp. 31GB23 TaxID=3156065 RepID=UPI0032AF454A